MENGHNPDCAGICPDVHVNEIATEGHTNLNYIRALSTSVTKWM